jgi:hypothetical protein
LGRKLVAHDDARRCAVRESAGVARTDSLKAECSLERLSSTATPHIARRMSGYGIRYRIELSPVVNTAAYQQSTEEFTVVLNWVGTPKLEPSRAQYAASHVLKGNTGPEGPYPRGDRVVEFAIRADEQLRDYRPEG